MFNRKKKAENCSVSPAIAKQVLCAHFVSDYTFATRLLSFAKDVQTNDAMSFEEREYIERVARDLVKHQIETATEQWEIEYLKRCHPNGA
jgi:hypothetical protein